MTPKINELIKLSKIKLFTKELIFFGMMLHRFDWTVYEFHPSMEGYVVFNEKDLSTIESGKIHLNEIYLNKLDYTFIHLVYLLCHELLHILNRHGLRKDDRIHKIWCVAADHVIEVYLRKNLSHLIKPYQNRYNIVERLESEEPNCSVEKAYDWLVKNEKFIEIEVELGDGDSPDTIVVKDQNGNILFEMTDDLSQSEKEDMTDSPEAIYQLNQLISEARAVFETIKSKGDLPGYLTTYLEELLKVEIPWERLVEKSIKTNIIMKPDDRSWRNLNKIYIPHGLILPGYSLTEDIEGVGTLIIFVDTSGSISDKNLKQFSNVVENSMRFFKEIHLITHDVQIHQQKIFNLENINMFYEFLKKEGYQGRGGTSHRYVFEFVEKEYWDKNKDELSMVISLTDMYSDIGSYYKDYNWIRNNIPLTFIITKGGKLISFDSSYTNISQIMINN